jgi:signal transduction histidine kinase
MSEGQWHLEDSPDQSFKQDGRLNVNNQAMITGERTKAWFTNVLLAINIVALVVLIFVYRHAAMVQDLKRWDLDNFLQTSFSDLKATVKSDHELIQAYGLQKTIHDTVQQTLEESKNGRPRDNQKQN